MPQRDSTTIGNLYDDETAVSGEPTMARPDPRSVLLIPCAGGDITGGSDRKRVSGTVMVGRNPPSALCLADDLLSRTHFRLHVHKTGNFVEDLGSTNGTFVNGRRIKGKHPLPDGALIRAGRSLFVLRSAGEDLLETQPTETFGMAGDFHTAPLIQRLEKLALATSNLLITGPSGAGKELATQAYGRICGRKVIVHNAAAFATEDQAAASLFGVRDGVFTGVSEKPGLIREADGKALFLDEAHRLPPRLQGSLLRAVEQGRICRIGETVERSLPVYWDQSLH